MPFSVTRNKSAHQAHVVMGCKVFGARHDDRYVLLLLNNILGGPSMTSRLNLSLREKAGLVYTVESLYGNYPDCGVWEVYFGCDPKDVERCRRRVERELERLIHEPLSPTQLRAAQKQYKAQIAISRTQAENHAINLGKTFALYGQVSSLEQIFARIDAVTADDIQRVAREWLAPNLLSILIYTPDETDSSLSS